MIYQLETRHFLLFKIHQTRKHANGERNVRKKKLQLFGCLEMLFYGFKDVSFEINRSYKAITVVLTGGNKQRGSEK